MRGTNAGLAVRELVELSDEVKLAIELLSAYERGDRRACERAWDVLGRAAERLEAASDHARTLRAE